MTPGEHVVVSEFGETPLEAIDRFASLVPMPAPDPAKLAPQDVIVTIKSASVAWVDLLMTSGQYQHMPKPPYTPGLEYAGVVSWAGPAVTSLNVGDAVMSDGLAVGPRSLGDYQAYGGFASYAVAPAEGLRKIPGKLTFDQACNLLGNYETAYHCLIARGRLCADDTVLIHGASGASGLAAVQLAKIVGAKVIATGRSLAKLEIVKAHGADHVIGGPDLLAKMRDEVKAITGGKGVSVVYDGVGGDISAESLRCVDFGARFLIVGWASTPFVAKGKGGRGAPNANQLPTNLVLMKGLDVLGCPTAITSHRDPSIRKERLERILGWADAGKIVPHVSHTFPLAEFKTAMRAKWNGDVAGGCVLHP